MAEPEVERPLTDEQLEAAASHVCYEVDQVALGTYRTAPARRNRDGSPVLADAHLGNVILEAFLVHVRVLDDFLGNSFPRGEDVLAIDYCPTYTPERPIAADDRLDIDRRIAHLTLRRTDNFQWGGRRRLQIEVFKQFRTFLDDLAAYDSTRADWFWPKFQVARKFVRSTMDGWPDQFQ